VQKFVRCDAADKYADQDSSVNFIEDAVEGIVTPDDQVRRNAHEDDGNHEQ